jgi:uncharacterized protein YndB with AHSA1/START domain
MKTITVKRTINAPVEKIFDLLTDHANYKDFPGILDSKLEVEGKPEKNGLGAVRHIKVKQGWFREKVTAYQRPNSFTYLITETSLPLKHEGGTLTFKAVKGGTEVTWISTAGMTVPLIGGLLDLVFAPMLEKGFAATLKDVDRRLAA